MIDLATVDHLLTTTRSVKRRLDLTRPVEPDVIRRCIEIALQAPTGSNYQGWHFMVVTDPGKRAALAELYRNGLKAYADLRGDKGPLWKSDDVRNVQREVVYEASVRLEERLQDVPVHVIPCIETRMEEIPFPLYGQKSFESFYYASLYGSILQAGWSLMLALRARGVGSAWTTIHLVYEKEAAAILGIPDNVTQTALLPVAYYEGTDFKPARRVPAETLTHWDTWGNKG
jgi:nitroreductase